MHKENRLAQRKQKTIIAMKDAMLINSGLPNNIWAKIMETTNYFHNRLFTKSKNYSKLVLEEV